MSRTNSVFLLNGSGNISGAECTSFFPNWFIWPNVGLVIHPNDRGLTDRTRVLTESLQGQSEITFVETPGLIPSPHSTYGNALLMKEMLEEANKSPQKTVQQIIDSKSGPVADQGSSAASFVFESYGDLGWLQIIQHIHASRNHSLRTGRKDVLVVASGVILSAVIESAIYNHRLTHGPREIVWGPLDCFKITLQGLCADRVDKLSKDGKSIQG